MGHKILELALEPPVIEPIVLFWPKTGCGLRTADIPGNFKLDEADVRVEGGPR